MNNKLVSRAMKETLRKIDMSIIENEYAKRKHSKSYYLIGMEIRNYFNIGKVTMSILKYSYGFNYCAARDKIINYGLSRKSA